MVIMIMLMMISSHDRMMKRNYDEYSAGCSATSPLAGSLMIIYDQMIVTIRMMIPVRWKIVMVSVMMIKELKLRKEEYD